MPTPSLPLLDAGRIATTLLAGATPQAREQALYTHWQALRAAKAQLPESPPAPIVIFIEGFASANSPLADIDDAALQIQRLAPACLCCSGNLVLNVHLNRMIRQFRHQHDVHLFISLADASHLATLREKLAAAQFQPYLRLMPDCVLA